MVYYKNDQLNATFAALADPTRRAMIAHLARQGEQSASALARPHAVSLPAALKHIGVLTKAGLVTRVKIGRTVHCRLEASRMREAIAWLERYEQFWSARLDALADFVERDDK